MGEQSSQSQMMAGSNTPNAMCRSPVLAARKRARACRLASGFHRCGVSLLEMLVMIAGAAVVLGVTVGLIQAIHQVERLGRDRVHHASTMGSLRRVFREHARTALRVQLPDAAAGSSNQLTFEFADASRVTYRIEANHVFVDYLHGDGRTVRRERFALPLMSRGDFEIRADGDQTWASVIVATTRGRPRSSGSDVLRIDVPLGSDHLLESR